jgi:DeoR/GlpR family transcriptional regulator of sugar metabolism
VICLGGEIRIISRALVGYFALSWLDHLRAGWAFLGASGLSAREGASTTELAEASVKQCFIARAAKRVLLADASKWEAPSTVQFAPWKDFDLWITSFDLPDPAASEIGRLSLEVIRAPRK